jgi:hypothetical protein
MLQTIEKPWDLPITEDDFAKEQRERKVPVRRINGKPHMHVVFRLAAGQSYDVPAEFIADVDRIYGDEAKDIYRAE